MKNRFILTAAVCICIFALAACGGGNSGNKETTKETQATQGGGQTTADVPSSSSEASGYVFTYKGVEIYAGEDASVIDQLGEPKDYSESMSCAFEGMDKQYFYGSFYVTTGTLKGHEFIANYWFVDDTVETDEGLCIGDSQDKVEEIYGADGFNGSNAYIYSKDDCELTIIIEDGSVSSIQYAYNN